MAIGIIDDFKVVKIDPEKIGVLVTSFIPFFLNMRKQIASGIDTRKEVDPSNCGKIYQYDAYLKLVNSLNGSSGDSDL